MAAKIVKIDPEHLLRINDQAEKIAALLGVDSESITIKNYGVALTPDQADALLALISTGYQRAIDTLRAAGEAANVEGPGRNLTAWAVYVSAASYLEQA